jgi:hypothetical protein
MNLIELDRALRQLRLHQYAVKSFCRSSIFQRTVNSVLTVCVSRGSKRMGNFRNLSRTRKL